MNGGPFIELGSVQKGYKCMEVSERMASLVAIWRNAFIVYSYYCNEESKCGKEI